MSRPTPVPRPKQWHSIPAQLAKLQSRGLLVADPAAAADFLRQLQELADDVGPDRTLLVIGSAFRGRKALAPGIYDARVTATDAAGNRSRAVRLRFTILR